MTTNNPRSEDILLNLFESALKEFGDTPQGALWPNEQDRITRFRVMLGLLDTRSAGPVSLCDLACGTGELLRYINDQGLEGIDYFGADISPHALRLAREKFPRDRFVEIDVTAAGAPVQQLACDYLIANGLFTVKHSISHESMWVFMESVLRAVWPVVRKGMAFNVMSKAVDWERADLFHVPMDDLARLLHAIAGRRIVFRGDYGLYEYTAYVYKPGAEPLSQASSP